MFETAPMIKSFLEEDDSHITPIEVKVTKETYNDGKDTAHELTVTISELLTDEMEFILSQGWSFCCLSRNLITVGLTDVHFRETCIRRVKA